ncbi:DNA annealing helicase and endonuclease ZRANB3-like [Ruditapes philippinarum]|uniref:DNA annealing helicase and endonuclease ZRANB3-like n=1 Tax=Ruditapes philippinarum TaxID=129788 RepID=UPI00295C1580|nr:DNA annealing helicase and endonuclease ZRANB3-like [Ruditapes philippinarum]
MVLETLPEKLVERLMPFQKEGVKFAVSKHGRCLIADEMGLGKTLQAISVAYYYRKEWPLLIIVPSSLRYSWIEEFEKWLPDINPGDINLVQSGNDVSDISTARVTITTFGLLSKGTSRILREALMNQAFHVVIVDESHYIRNAKTVSAKTVVPIIKNANRRILLSGTPALARPVELYPQIDAICPDEFGSWWTYTARYCDAKLEWIGKIKRRNVNGASNLEELQQRLSDKLMIRREKSQVLTQLPPKQRQRVLFELKDSDLKKEIRQTFDELRPLMKRSNQDNFEVLTGGADHDAKDTNMLSLIQRLYKLSGTAKIGPAKEYIEMLCENRKLKFLVFAYHHDMMNGLSESLHDKNIKFIRIDGETPPSERPHLVHQFQSDPDIRVAVLSILAAGVGLTFTAATLVVFAEMYWTPGTMIQCEDRAHRIGQTSCVAVHYLVAKDTMDEWVWSAVCKKTIVTSTTLTGKKRKMEADEGDRYQVDVLSNAEVWVPATNSETSNLTEYFETTLDSNQKSILHFFSPKHIAMKRKLKESSEPINDESGQRVITSIEDNYSSDECSVEESCHTPASKRLKIDSRLKSSSTDKKSVTKEKRQEHIIVLDSDGEDDFVDTSSKKKSLSSSKKVKGKIVKRSSISPKCNLDVMFDKVRNKSENVTESDEFTSRGGSKGSDDTGKVSEDKRFNSKDWSCSQCTYLNHKALSYCEMCETPKKSKPLPKKCQPKSVVKKSPKNDTDSEFDICSHSTSVSNNMQDIDDEEDTVNIDDTLDFDPGTENDFTAGDSTDLIDIEKVQQANPRSKQVNEKDKDCQQQKMVENEDHVVNEDDFENVRKVDMTNTGIENSLETGGVANESNISNGKFVVSQSKYFSKDGLTDVDHLQSEKKEIVINNTLNFNTIKQIDVQQNNQCAKITCNTDTTKLTKDKNTTPTSGKTYKFKSIRKGTNPTNSPGAYNPFGAQVNNVESRNNTPVRINCANDIANCNRDTIGSEVEKKDVSVSNTLDNSAHVSNSVRNPDLANDFSNKGQNVNSLDTGNDHSFSSSELDEILASETDHVTKRTDEVTKEEKRIVNLDTIPVYTMLKYQCSKYTDRVYLLTQEEEALNVNFIPSDVQFGNDDGLPDLLLHPDNLRLVQRFVREWQSLTETKRRLIIKSGQPFISPIQQYEKLKSCKTVNTQRHRTKIDASKAAHEKAKDINGSVRILSKHAGVHSDNSGEAGVSQAVSEDGTPLCLQCFKPYTNPLITKTTIHDENNAWNTRFCSQKCSQEYWSKTNNDYMRDRVFEAEHGVCQMCKFDAHSLFRKIRDTVDQRKRAEFITSSKFNSLTVKIKEQMVRKPTAGQFWHADHIKPVWEGGGQCDIDNLRTLCVICHQKVTAQQAAKRATVRKLGTAVNSGDITAFFKRN